MHYLDLATIALYLIAITWFGAHFRKSQHNLKEDRAQVFVDPLFDFLLGS